MVMTHEPGSAIRQSVVAMIGDEYVVGDRLALLHPRNAVLDILAECVEAILA